MELVYKLKGLDYLFDHVNQNFFKGLVPDRYLNRYYVGPMNEFFDVDFFDIKNYRWLACAYLRKSDGNVGDIHSDVVYDESLCPAINIIWSGKTVMEFWDIGKPENKPSGTVKSQRVIRLYDHITWPSDYSYTMERGIYLVNATGPHRATCYGDRHLFSIRCPDLFVKKWPEILSEFDDLIER